MSKRFCCLLLPKEGLTEEGCPYLSLELIFNARFYVYRWFTKCIDLGIKRDNLKTRADNLKALYEWLKFGYVTFNAHFTKIDNIMGCIHFHFENVRSLTSQEKTKKQRMYLNQEELKTVPDVLRYKDHPNYVKKLNELQTKLADPEFLQRLTSPDALKSNKDIKEYYFFLVGAICGRSHDQCQT